VIRRMYRGSGRSAGDGGNFDSGGAGDSGGRAFKRAEAIFLAVKEWNRLNPSESFAFNAGILETVFRAIGTQ
jgi:hypothetical protein